MKKIITFIAISIMLTSCEFGKLSTIQDDFVITVAAEPVQSYINLNIFNSKDGTNIPESVSISFSGPDADQIFTASGTSDFKIENGLITVGVNRNYVLSADNPLNVTANFSAVGYLTAQRTISFDGSDIREEQVGLLEEENLPKSIVFKSASEVLTGNKTTTDITVETSSSTNAEETIDFVIPADTEFYDEDGLVLTGTEITADFQTFDPTTPDLDALTVSTENPESLPAGFNEFPGSMEIGADASNKSSSNKTKINQGYLVPIASQLCLYYYVNGKKVWGTSRPTRINAWAWRGLVNPNTNQQVKAGDIIAVYRNVNGSNVKLVDVPLVSYRGWFRAQFTAPGPGIYSYGFEVFPSANCSANSTINSVKFNNTGRRSFYFYSVANKYNPNRPIRYGYMYFDGVYEVTNRSSRRWSNRALALLEDDMVLKIYNYSYDERRFKVVYNKEVSKCELDGQTTDISNTDCFAQRNMDLTVDCPDATYRLNNTYVYYKPEGRRWYSYFDRVINSQLNGKTPCLEAGIKYQFGFWYNGWKETPPLTEVEMIDLYKNFDLDLICREIRANR
ncbi:MULTISPECIES: hypothetical protein [unclassified Polaribacter]|uniref:hypothetical protein n=1 Tax=unclassified Polaribacter TaxID=196858 RepID=UPI0011BE949F|nr:MULTISPECIES: hypothetical protein [unclassified Polaribacter]TXD48504.1 hypothetical protein ES043_17750 [Polaribacter sp. IC063]TXD55837.1 hypothetical protein ES044_17710 [Polaribacter sp. IC066]